MPLPLDRIYWVVGTNFPAHSAPKGGEGRGAMLYGILADLVVAIHVAYVSVVVFGLLAIVLGRPFGWEWVRNRWFRVIHLVMIGIVATEAVFNWDCPLTVWEAQLRVAAGQTVADGTF